MRLLTPLLATLLTAMALVALLALPAAAIDTSGVYAGVKLGGVSMKNDNPDLTRGGTTVSESGTDHRSNNFIIGGELGYDFYPSTSTPVRLALEYAYRTEHKLDNTMGGASSSIKTNVHTLFVNGYVDLHIDNSPFTPYVTGGLGMAFHSIEADAGYFNPNGLDDNSTDLAWNLGLGVGYAINQNLTFDISYRYADYGTADISDNFGTKVKYDLCGHEFLAGLRYAF